MPSASGRVTQADVARIAGVSQAMVSLVLNGSQSVRIAPETRRRVEEVLRSTGYTVDIMGRRLRGKSNQILGVFAYESVFPSRVADFYRPFLLGIEEEAGTQGFDLLLFTSPARRDGRRVVYEQGTNRLRIADGCLLLGRHNDPQELSRLVEEAFPFVFIGRRESAAGPVSYVGADYAAATGEVYAWMRRLGHRRIALLSGAGEHEPTLDRRVGYRSAAAAHGGEPVVIEEEDPAAALRAAREQEATALLVESASAAHAVRRCAARTGLGVPRDLSIAVLGDSDPSGFAGEPEAMEPDAGEAAADWSMFRIPRREMGARAVRMLTGLVSGGAAEGGCQVLLPCEIHEGTTVGAPAG